MQQSLNIPNHLKHVATLLCENIYKLPLLTFLPDSVFGQYFSFTKLCVTLGAYVFGPPSVADPGMGGPGGRPH